MKHDWSICSFDGLEAAIFGTQRPLEAGNYWRPFIVLLKLCFHHYVKRGYRDMLIARHCKTAQQQQPASISGRRRGLEKQLLVCTLEITII
jgi:hypothetical protein